MLWGIQNQKPFFIPSDLGQSAWCAMHYHCTIYSIEVNRGTRFSRSAPTNFYYYYYYYYMFNSSKLNHQLLLFRRGPLRRVLASGTIHRFPTKRVNLALSGTSTKKQGNFPYLSRNWLKVTLFRVFSYIIQVRAGVTKTGFTVSTFRSLVFVGGIHWIHWIHRIHSMQF
jgi:hypothetical protein